MDVSLKIENLKKHFGEKVVLDDVSFELKSNSVTVIIGKSGTGKSVLLKLIAGILEQNGGSIQWYDSANGEAINMDQVSLSYMFQNNALFDSMTAFENIALPLLESPKKVSDEEVQDRVNTLLKQLDLENIGTVYPGQLSGGMNKRVAFARALITKPKSVLFDEPTTGLDPERKFTIFELIKRYKEVFGFSALLVSHDIPEVYTIADSVIWLDDGIVKYFGAPDEFNSVPDPSVKKFLKTGRIHD